METCRSIDVYPIVAAEMANMHSRIATEDTTESKLWIKINTCNDLVEEILQNNPTLTQK
jgi:hypothetical protein